MKKTTLTTLITAVAIGAVGITAFTPAFARSGDHGPRGLRFNFEEMDLNSDGKITQEEMAEYREAKFAAQDTDGNGLLSSEELVNAVIEQAKTQSQKRVERMIEHRDTDGDGQISLAELPGNGDRASKFFNRLDANGDGEISSDEMQAMQERFGHGKPGWGKKKNAQPENE